MITDVFPEKDLKALLVAARIALADADVFDHVRSICDISDVELYTLREMLSSISEDSEVNHVGSVVDG